jgi:diguanylate cyclase (GGDEF)-like protein/PAS domain S-box-containing protein
MPSAMGAPDQTRDALPDAAAEALSRLSEAAVWQEEVGATLAVLGGSLGADRCAVFQNLRGHDGRLWMDLVAEWRAPEVRPIFDDPEHHLHPYFPTFARWIDELGAGRPIAGPVSSFPENEWGALAAEGTVATVQHPVAVRGEWWGFVQVDVCREGASLAPRDERAAAELAAAVAAGVERQRAAEDEALREDLFRSIVQSSPAVSYIDDVDEGASTLYISPQIVQMLGYTPEEWTTDGDMWSKVLHPDDRVRALAENVRHNETGERFRLEYRVFHKDGHIVWVHDEATLVRDERGLPRYSHGVMVDISERKRTEEQVAFRAYHDELTGLPSRAMFEELLELSVGRARRHDAAVAVLCVDLDDFRLVNDSLGHETGDRLLRLVADRLREVTPDTDFVARRGGDQFLLLLADLSLDEHAHDGAVVRSQAVAQRIQEALAAPFDVAGTEVYVSARIGISIFPLDAEDVGGLQRNVEAAMFEAKRVGSSSSVMARGADSDSSARLQFVTRLRKAVETQRWALHYQPVLALETGRMRGVEALIRWVEPDGTLIPPLEFIPVAEELGLIEQIGDWVVKEIAYQVHAWRELDIDVEVGFNLSPRQFWQPDLAERIVHAFRNGGVDPTRVVVEVTESSAMMDPDRAQGILLELHRAGFSIAIDDFGTGYSSLSRLREMPVDVLKIDRSFVSNLDEDAGSASIVTAFLELARGLDITTLAEGIETPEELAFLRERGCALGQGFYFSRPVPPEEIIAYAFGGIPNAAFKPRRR